MKSNIHYIIEIFDIISKLKNNNMIEIYSMNIKLNFNNILK